MADTAIEVKKQATPMRPSGLGMDPFQSLRNDMDRLFDQLWRGAFAFPALPRLFGPVFREAGAGLPAVDVSEDENAYHIEAELPGLTQRDIDVKLTGSTLTIKGERSEEKEEKEKSYHVSERRYGAFERAFALPEDIDRDKIEATFENGILHLVLPKAAEAVQQQKKIEVKTK